MDPVVSGVFVRDPHIAANYKWNWRRGIDKKVLQSRREVALKVCHTVLHRRLPRTEVRADQRREDG